MTDASTLNFASEVHLGAGFSGIFRGFSGGFSISALNHKNATLKPDFFTPKRLRLGSGTIVTGINKRTHVRTVVKRSQTTRFQAAFDHFNAKNSKTYFSISHQI